MQKSNMCIIVGSYYDIRVIAFESKMFHWLSSIFHFVIAQVNCTLITTPKTIIVQNSSRWRL